MLNPSWVASELESIENECAKLRKEKDELKVELANKIAVAKHAMNVEIDLKTELEIYKSAYKRVQAELHCVRKEHSVEPFRFNINLDGNAQLEAELTNLRERVAKLERESEKSK